MKRPVFPTPLPRGTLDVDAKIDIRSLKSSKNHADLYGDTALMTLQRRASDFINET